MTRIEWCLQLSHRLAIVAVLLLVGLAYTINAAKPVYALGWTALFAADAAVVLGAAMTIAAYRADRSIRPILAMLLFALLIAHAAGYLLLTGFDAWQWTVGAIHHWAPWLLVPFIDPPKPI